MDSGRTPPKLYDLASLTDQFAALTVWKHPTTLLLFNVRQGRCRTKWRWLSETLTWLV